MHTILTYSTKFLLAVACGLALFVALFGTVDAVSTFAFNRPIPLARELPEELLPLIIFLALPQVVQDDRNISVDFLVEGAPIKVKKLLEAAALLIAFLHGCASGASCNQKY
ncbi:TRAP transporter small permease subunit [uncultured Tateyamaria sp.]|uniref:TRAP transporter small permease n=1 Tax=uncultured Tateyamaria sp. TaxID=455651 RepID=UPI00263690E1|nr:TRAP transporter small permease subunit [uncultured Tateyamaria sp.]